MTQRRTVPLMGGTQSDASTESVDRSVKRLRVMPSRALLAKAQRALERILGEDSALKELWHEGDAVEGEASPKALKAIVATR